LRKLLYWYGQGLVNPMQPVVGGVVAAIAGTITITIRSKHAFQAQAAPQHQQLIE